MLIYGAVLKISIYDMNLTVEYLNSHITKT